MISHMCITHSLIVLTSALNLNILLASDVFTSVCRPIFHLPLYVRNIGTNLLVVIINQMNISRVTPAGVFNK